jgi:hypothetical protein
MTGKSAIVTTNQKFDRRVEAFESKDMTAALLTALPIAATWPSRSLRACGAVANDGTEALR